MRTRWPVAWTHNRVIRPNGVYGYRPISSGRMRCGSRLLNPLDVGSDSWLEPAEIDELVYELYRISDSERKIVEEHLQVPPMSPKRQSRMDSPLVRAENLPESQAKRWIEALHLPTRPYNALKWLGVDSVGQLFALSERELLKGRGMGRKCIEDIQKALWVFLQPSSSTSSGACEPPEHHTLIRDTGGVDFSTPRTPGWPFIYLEDNEAREEPKPRGSGRSRVWLIPEPVCADLDAPVARLGLSTRAHTVIDRLGIKTIEQLLHSSRRNLLRARNFGPKCDAETQAKLFAYLSGKGIFSSAEPQLETMEFVNRLLSTRSQVQQNIIRARYGFWDGHRKTLRHLGNEMGLTKERIRQIQNEALAQIRGLFGLALIKDFVNAKIAAHRKLNAASTGGIVREDEGPAALAHGCSVGQASLALAFLQDLFPSGVSILAQCRFEVEGRVIYLGDQPQSESKQGNDC